MRIHMIHLRYEGYGSGDCVGILDVHPNTITTWTKLYIQRGLYHHSIEKWLKWHQNQTIFLPFTVLMIGLD